MNSWQKLIGIGVAIALMLFVITTFFMERINVGNVGLKVNQTGSDKGVSDIKYVTGFTFYLPWLTDVVEYSVRSKTVKMEDFGVTALGGGKFIAHPQYVYNVIPTRADTTYKVFGTNNMESIEQGFLHTIMTKAMGDVANKFSPDSLISARERYETEVETRVKRDLFAYGFYVSFFRANLTPPDEISKAIARKQEAIIDAQAIENQKLSVIAEGEKRIAAARADSASKVIAAIADAKVIELQQNALKQSPQYVELIKAQRWDGKLPQYMLGSGGVMLQLQSKQ